jgi:hypothetical protein
MLLLFHCRVSIPWKILDVFVLQMAPINTAFIISAYEALNGCGSTISNISRALKAASCLLDGGISATLETVLETIVSWMYNVLAKQSTDECILACLLRYYFCLICCFHFHFSRRLREKNWNRVCNKTSNCSKKISC